MNAANWKYRLKIHCNVFLISMAIRPVNALNVTPIYAK